jgi:hypothetical protein
MIEKLIEHDGMSAKIFRCPRGGLYDTGHSGESLWVFIEKREVGISSRDRIE